MLVMNGDIENDKMNKRRSAKPPRESDSTQRFPPQEHICIYILFCNHCEASFFTRNLIHQKLQCCLLLRYSWKENVFLSWFSEVFTSQGCL